MPEGHKNSKNPTCSCTGFAGGVDGAGREVGNHLQELRLGRGRVTHDTHVQVAPTQLKIPVKVTYI